MSGLSTQNLPLVLVVDDDPDVLDMLSHVLRARRFRVLTAADTDTALLLCQEHDGRIDALVADLSMPGDLQGRLAREVAAAYPGITIVFCTGIPRYIAVATGLVRPDATYLDKPVNPDVLEGTLRTALKARSAKRP